MGVVYNSRKFRGDHLYSFCDTRLETEPVVLFSRGRDSMSKVGGVCSVFVKSGITKYFSSFDPLTTKFWAPPYQKVGGGAQAPPAPQVLCLCLAFSRK